MTPFLELVTGVRDYLAAADITAVVERGWKARSKQTNQGPGRANRVVFSGSRPDGAAGRIVQPRQVGPEALGDDAAAPTGYRRPLADWQRVILVSVWAYDGTSPNDEGAQDDAAYELLLWTMRAVNAVAFGNAAWGNVGLGVPGERAFGLELLAELTFQSPMFDVASDVAFPTALVVRPT